MTTALKHHKHKVLANENGVKSVIPVVILPFRLRCMALSTVMLAMKVSSSLISLDGGASVFMVDLISCLLGD